MKYIFLLLIAFSSQAFSSEKSAEIIPVNNIDVSSDILDGMKYIDKNFNSTYNNDVRHKQLILGVINDFFTPNNTDRNLTNGIRVGFISDKLPDFMNWYRTQGSKDYYVVTLTQEMYTPEDLSKKEYDKNDRPYAGWLYATVAIAKRRDNTLMMTVLDIGVVGPSSQADVTQTMFHKFIESPTPMGWDNQLRNELGINIKQYFGKTARYDKNMFNADLTGIISGSLGNVDTSVSTTIMARVGYNVPDDMLMYGYDADDSEAFSFYTFAGVSGSYVMRDIFLDGNTFENGPSIEKNNFVGNAFIGTAVRYKSFELSYTYIKESKRFVGQDGIDRTGVLMLTYKKKF